MSPFFRNCPVTGRHQKNIDKFMKFMTSEDVTLSLSPSFWRSLRNSSGFRIGSLPPVIMVKDREVTLFTSPKEVSKWLLNP